AQNQRFPVLVAKAKMAAYSALRKPDEQFELVERSVSEGVPRNRVDSYEELKDRILIKGMEPGEPITAEHLQDRSKVGLEAVLQKGHRAVALRTTAETVAGGTVMPMSRVDIIAS